MSEFPTSDADIRALRIKILRQLGAKDYPAQAIGPVAAGHKLTVDDVKSLVGSYGWPDPKEMRRYAFELELGKVPAQSTPPAAQPPVPQQPSTQALAIERLLNAAERSPHARTKKLAVRIRANLNDLRELVIAERKASEDAAAKAAEQARLKAEVAALEAQLAAKKAQLKPGVHRESTTPKGNAKEIRAWASKHSVECPERGRLPRDVVEAYELATAGAA